MSLSTANHSRALGAVLLLILLGAQGGAIALAQSTSYQPIPYDPNCKRMTVPEDKRFEEEIFMTHAGARLVGAIGEYGCKAVEFIRNFGEVSPSGEINNDIVMDSVMPDFPTTSTGQRILQNVRRAASKGYGAVGEMLKLNEREVGYAEMVPVEGGLRSGSLISSTGTMARGTFDANYKLSGSGQLVTPDGKVRAGEFSNNQLRGEGFIAEKDGNRTVLVEGTFDGDTPVGEVIRNYADGSRVRELWENGRMVARGERAPKGKVPPPIHKPEDKQLASAVQPPGGAVQKGPPASAFRTGNMIERTLEPSKTRPVASIGRVLNPLIVQGPPWPCASEIDGYMAAWGRRTGGRGVKSAQQYWGEFNYSPVYVMLNSANRTVLYFHDQYLAVTPNAMSQPVVFTFSGTQLREGFFRNGRSMTALASGFEAGRASEVRGGEGEAGMAMNACIARYLADNARD